MIRRTPLKRSTPVRKVRPGTRRGQPTKEEKGVLRQIIYDLSGGQCEMHLVPECLTGVLAPEGSIFERWHLVHMGAKRRFGWPVTGTMRMRGGCYWCHIVGMHEKGLKPQCL